jgi:hypothetical protein
MSLTPAVTETLRQALATVVVVPVTPLLADGNPDWAAYARLTRRLLPDPVKQEISAMLTSWGLA